MKNKVKQFIIIFFLVAGVYALINALTEEGENPIGYKTETQRVKKDSVQILKEATAYSNLKKDYDEIEQYYWYHNSLFTHYINETHISLYIGLKQGQTTPFMRLKLSCTTEDVLGMDMVILYCDGNTMELPIDYFSERKFDNNGKICWEWVDISIRENYITFIEKMSKGNDVRVRFKGQFNKDYTVSKIEKQALEQVILGYNNFFN